MLPLFLIPSLINAGVGVAELLGADKGIDQLNKTPAPQYTVSPELQTAYNQAGQMASRGYAPEQKASFRHNIGQDINTKLQRAKDIGGGNLARTISGIGNINLGDAENKFAASDAMLKDQHVKYAGVLAQAIQHQKNLQTQSDLHHRLLVEQSLGMGKKTGIENIGNAINFAALMAGGNKVGGDGVKIPDNPFGVNNSLALAQGLNSSLGNAQKSQYDWNISGNQDYSLNPQINNLEMTQ